MEFYLTYFYHRHVQMPAMQKKYNFHKSKTCMKKFFFLLNRFYHLKN